jgi:dTDP-4-dehydrorhamnose reductase
LIKETWERYGLPLAITEAHLGCTREEQLRWLKEVWDGAQSLRQEGADVRAVTAWSLLGAHDWDSLITREEGHYEPGVFDLRAPRPRPTALFQMLRDLASEGEHAHPVLDSPGWWRRLDRLCYPPVARRTQAVAPALQGVSMKGERGRSLLVTGGSGTLGKAFARICERRGLSYRLLTRQEMDIADPLSVNAVLDQHRPWAVINAAGYVRVDDAELEPELCQRENTQGPETLAAACAKHKAALLTFSSDLVFDGAKRSPYVESDPASPLNVYGRSKAEAERRVLEALPEALVVRTSAFFGPWDKYNFVTAALNSLSEERIFCAADDALISPTYVPDLVHASLDLLIDGERGIWHLANGGALTWAELARRVAALAGLDASLVDARPSKTLSPLASRPVYSVLGSQRGTLLPPLENALSRYLQECEILFRETRRYSQHRQ